MQELVLVIVDDSCQVSPLHHQNITSSDSCEEPDFEMILPTDRIVQIQLQCAHPAARPLALLTRLLVPHCSLCSSAPDLVGLWNIFVTFLKCPESL